MDLNLTRLQNLSLKQENKRSILLSFLNQDESEIRKEMEEKPLFFLDFLTNEERELCLSNFFKEKKFLDEIKKSFSEKPHVIIKTAHNAGWTEEEIINFIGDSGSESSGLKSFVENIINTTESEKSDKHQFLYG